MKPLNSQDRMKQFFIFLAFFLVTTVLVVAVTYFDFSNPKEHNRLLIDENTNLKKQLEISDKYISQVDALLNYCTELSTVNLNGMETKAALANSASANFKVNISSDSLLRNSVYSRFSTLTNSFINVYNEFIKAKPKADELENIKKENDKLTEKNNKLEDKLKACQKICPDCN